MSVRPLQGWISQRIVLLKNAGTVFSISLFSPLTDPNVIESKSKAVAYIGRRLQKQYENLSKMMNKVSAILTDEIS